MRLYQVTIPTHDNAGRSYEAARKRWASGVIVRAGGITEPAGFSQGVWVDQGREYRETVVNYTVACSAETFKGILAFTFECFPDQLAIMTADLGSARINARPVSQAA